MRRDFIVKPVKKKFIISLKTMKLGTFSLPKRDKISSLSAQKLVKNQRRKTDEQHTDAGRNERE